MYNEQAILESALRGETTAFAQLVTRYRDYVFTIALRVLSRREEAEEASQDAFVKAWRTLHSFKGNAKFSTWLYRIALHTAIDYGRKKGLPIQDLEGDGGYLQVADSGTPDAHERLEQQEGHGRLDKAIALLPEQDGLLVTLFYLHEKSVEEVSQITGLSASNVKVRMFRARTKLKGLLTGAAI